MANQMWTEPAEFECSLCHGIVPESEFTCPHCGAELELEDEDALADPESSISEAAATDLKVKPAPGDEG